MEGGEVNIGGRTMSWCITNLVDMPSMKVESKIFSAWSNTRDRSVRLRLATDTRELANDDVAKLIAAADELELRLPDGSSLLLAKEWNVRPLRLEDLADRLTSSTGRVWGRWNGAPLNLTSLSIAGIGNLEVDEVTRLMR